MSARLLLAHALDCSQEQLIASLRDPVSRDQEKRFRGLVARRAQGEPAAYILGRKEFYGLDFQVGPKVLIPRPETELLVDLVLKRFQQDQEKVFADLGTGSGILAVCIARYFPLFRGLACDNSEQALGWAVKNAYRHAVRDRILFFAGDMGSAVQPSSLDFIVCNPPYLSPEDYGRTSLEIQGFEPVDALLSQERGLGHINRLEHAARHSLRVPGILFLEMGSSQAGEVRDIFRDWSRVEIFKDLAGLDRVAVAEKA